MRTRRARACTRRSAQRATHTRRLTHARRASHACRAARRINTGAPNGSFIDTWSRRSTAAARGVRTHKFTHGAARNSSTEACIAFRFARTLQDIVAKDTRYSELHERAVRQAQVLRRPTRLRIRAILLHDTKHRSGHPTNLSLPSGGGPRVVILGHSHLAHTTLHELLVATNHVRGLVVPAVCVASACEADGSLASTYRRRRGQLRASRTRDPGQGTGRTCPGEAGRGRARC